MTITRNTQVGASNAGDDLPGGGIDHVAERVHGHHRGDDDSRCYLRPPPGCLNQRGDPDIRGDNEKADQPYATECCRSQQRRRAPLTGAEQSPGPAQR